MSRWVVCRRAGWSGRVAALLAGAALLWLRAQLSSRFEADFPHHKPDQLSQFLADFNNHPKLYAHIRFNSRKREMKDIIQKNLILNRSGSWQVEEERNNYTWWQYVVSYECGARSGSWQVEEERNNYTWWQYVVSYECGARCVGRVVLGAGVSGETPRHGRALGEHRMHVWDERCMHLPLLFWPQMCVETKTETIIKPRVGGGAHLSEYHISRCSALAALTQSCGAYSADERERALRAAMRTILN